MGLDKPFAAPGDVEFRVHAVPGEGFEADVPGRHLIGAAPAEPDCGRMPEAPRFDTYPAGPNSSGALHIGIIALMPSEDLHRVISNREEPRVQFALVTPRQGGDGQELAHRG